MFGKHIVIDVKNIKDAKLLYLCDCEELENNFFCNVPDILDLNVIRQCRNQFKPFGATILYLLSTSHCSIHTFVEERCFTMDVYTCNEETNLLIILDYIKDFWNISDKDMEFKLLER